MDPSLRAPPERACRGNLNRFAIRFQVDIWRVNRSYETIALRWDGDDEFWRIGIIIQRPPDLAYCRVDTALGVDEDAFTPDSIDDLTSGYQLPSAFHQKTQKFERDTFEMDDATIAAKLVDALVQLEILESV